MDEQMYTSDQLIDLCDDVLTMLNGTNESVADLTEDEKAQVADNASEIILNTSKNKIKLMLKSLDKN